MPENEYFFISALQHFVFCQRQCALIHIEQQWAENFLTAKGQILHQNVDKQKFEKRSTIRQETAVELVSHRLGLKGKADLIEYQKIGTAWIPTPVEFKKGNPKTDKEDILQLIAQILCLEEMTNQTIQKAFLYYFGKKKRIQIDLNAELRDYAEKKILEFRDFLNANITPVAKYEKKCDSCSLIHLCLPKPHLDINDYFEANFK